jgi:hypothetical protein
LALKAKDTIYLLLIIIRGLRQFILFIKRISGSVLYKGTTTKSILNSTLKSLEFVLTIKQSSVARK